MQNMQKKTRGKDMQVTPLTKKQWVSVLTNSLLAFVAVFLPAIVYSPELNQAVVKSALVAGLMASLKIVQKAFTEE